MGYSSKPLPQLIFNTQEMFYVGRKTLTIIEWKQKHDYTQKIKAVNGSFALFPFAEL